MLREKQMKSQRSILLGAIHSSVDFNYVLIHQEPRLKDTRNMNLQCRGEYKIKYRLKVSIPCFLSKCDMIK